MNSYLDKYKGIHPGIVLERELKKRAIKKRPFALLVDEHPQTINAITKGKRSMNTPLALKIEERLGLEEGTLAILQTYYDIRKEKQGQKTEKPNLSVLRKSLFWDTDVESIDWKGQSKAVILRVLDRGNEDEKNEIVRFYGPDKVDEVVHAERKYHTSPKVAES